MAAPFGQFTLAQIESSVQSALVALRNDLNRVQNIHAWLSAYSAGLAQLASTGTDSRNPGAGYVYMSSINAVAGPYS